MNFLPDVFSINSAVVAGELVIGGCKSTALAKEFGTPLFVIDEGDFKSRINGWKTALNKNFGASAGQVYYASKSFLSVEVAKWIDEAGIGVDVCTGGELAVALHHSAISPRWSEKVRKRWKAKFCRCRPSRSMSPRK